MPGFRKDFNLDEILGERYAQHYMDILNGATRPRPGVLPGDQHPWAPFDEPGSTLSWSNFQVIDPARRLPGPAGSPDDKWMDQLGRGPDWATSCADLARSPEITWDVCGYYRRILGPLGMPAAVLMAACRIPFRDLAKLRLLWDPTTGSEPAHYALMMLRNPGTRRSYDMMGLGLVFMADRGVQEDLRRAAHRESARRIARGEQDAGEGIRPVLGEWGLDGGLDPEETARRSAAAQLHGQGSEPGGAGSALGSVVGTWESKWAWYLMGPDGWEGPPRRGRILEAWQSFMSAALASLGVKTRFAVGIHSGKGTRLWRGRDGLCIFFISSTEPPDPDMAMMAAQGYMAQEHTRSPKITRRPKNAKSGRPH